MATYECRVSAHVATTKDEALKKAGIFINQIKNGQNVIVRHTVNWIIKKMLSGYSINLTEVGERSLFMLDIDNKGDSVLSHEAILEILAQNHCPPAAILTTLSSTDETPRYHILFATVRPMKEWTEYRNLIKRIAKIINNIVPKSVDMMSATRLRLFFPCIAICFKDISARIDPTEIPKPISAEKIIEPIEPMNFIAFKKAFYNDNCLNNDDTVHHIDALHDKLTKTSLKYLLSMPENESVTDILDSNMTAVISFTPEGKSSYNRYCHDKHIKSLDIYQLVKDLYGLDTIKEAYEYITEKLNVTAKPLDHFELEERINKYLVGLKHIESYPALLEVMSRNSSGLLEILKAVLNNISMVNNRIDTVKSCNQFWVTRKSLGAESKTVYRKLHTLFHLGLLINESRENYSEVIKKDLLHAKHKNNPAFIIVVPELTDLLLEKANRLAIVMSDNDQYESTLTNSISCNNIIDKIVAVINTYHNALGNKYILMDNLCEIIKDILPVQIKYRKKKVKSLMPEIMKRTGYEYCTVSKTMLEKYNISNDNVYINVSKIILFEKEG